MTWPVRCGVEGHAWAQDAARRDPVSPPESGGAGVESGQRAGSILTEPHGNHEVSMNPKKVIQDRPPNFREDGKLYLVRCFVCNRENWAMLVSSGQCAWCGWKKK